MSDIKNCDSHFLSDFCQKISQILVRIWCGILSKTDAESCKNLMKCLKKIWWFFAEKNFFLFFFIIFPTIFPQFSQSFFFIIISICIVLVLISFTYFYYPSLYPILVRSCSSFALHFTATPPRSEMRDKSVWQKLLLKRRILSDRIWSESDENLKRFLQTADRIPWIPSIIFSFFLLHFFN